LTVVYSNHERTLKVQTATAYLEALNPEQRRAVEHGQAGGLAAPPLLVIAGAGSGKTNTLAHRVAHLIVQGADPRRILLMTFSRRAADQTGRTHRAQGVGRQRRCHDRRADLGRHLPRHRRSAIARIR
jgi:DNA helicase-2/ATP-dependent DNA helicase PcrA